MEDELTRALQHALEAVDKFYDEVFAALDAWLPKLKARLIESDELGALSGAQMTAIVKEGALGVLDTADLPLYGAGYCASDVIVGEGNPLAWWQGPERSLLASSAFGPGQAAIDLERLEWYRVPASTGERHVAGPFVDYLCSNEITITCSLPVFFDDRFGGVICADVLVASLENILRPTLAELDSASLVNAHGRVVVSTAPDLETGDRFVYEEQGENSSRQANQTVSASEVLKVQSLKYPFSLVVVR